MTTPVDTPRPPSSPGLPTDYPFGQGLDRATTLRLLSDRFDREDLTRYYETPHFRRLRTAVIETYGGCVLCGCRFRKRLTAHHRHYRTLFQEDVLKDTSCICRECHRRFHRK